MIPPPLPLFHIWTRLRRVVFLNWMIYLPPFSPSSSTSNHCRWPLPEESQLFFLHKLPSPSLISPAFSWGSVHNLCYSTAIRLISWEGGSPGQHVFPWRLLKCAYTKCVIKTAASSPSILRGRGKKLSTLHQPRRAGIQSGRTISLFITHQRDVLIARLRRATWFDLWPGVILRMSFGTNHAAAQLTPTCVLAAAAVPDTWAWRVEGEDLFQSLNSPLPKKVEHLTRRRSWRSAGASLCRDGEILNSSLSTHLDLTWGGGGEGTLRLLELPELGDINGEKVRKLAVME